MNLVSRNYTLESNDLTLRLHSFNFVISYAYAFTTLPKTVYLQRKVNVTIVTIIEDAI